MKNQHKINRQLDKINATKKGYKSFKKSGITGFLAKVYAGVRGENIRAAKKEIKKLFKTN